MNTADIKQGLINAIATEFPNATIYTEKVPQNFEDGSFRVKSITTTNRPELDTRRWREVLFDVVYFPKALELAEEEWEIVKDRLFNSVEWVTVIDTPLRGKDLSADYDSEQEVGHFKITFGFMAEKVKEDVPKMETLEL
jgi:hypothetical protein